MYGWRAKLGLILPSNNTVAEPELVRYVPSGVSVHGTKVLARAAESRARVESMVAALSDARDALVDSRVHAIAYGCMKSCLVKGPEWEATTCRGLSAEVIPFATAGAILRAALEALGARRVAIFSPYGDDVAELVPEYFAAAGYELVANVNRSNLADPYLVVSTHPEDLFRGIVSLPPADALCILATDLPTFQILEALEQTWGGPVITSNLAMLWWLLRSAGVREALPQLGTLGQHRGRS